MIAAVYCRKSTEQAVADDAKSVTRQIEHAREYAVRKGWTINDACIFADDGISGAEFANRPGFVRLMASLKPRPPFQVLIMSEDSRLGREAIETAYALKQIIQAGVRVFFYLEDRERTLDSPIEKAMLALQTMSDEMEREKARQRMVDTMIRKAKAGHVTGGQCFGYDNVPVVGANGQRSHVEYQINEAEAAVIRRIFELAAAGQGQNAIAKTLNAEGFPAPRSQQDRPRAWVQSSVHEALFRDRYRGITIWNKTKKRDRWGQLRVTDRDRAEWVKVETPHLRIVPEDLWNSAHRRIAASAAETNITRRRGRGSTSRYLLPGLARCAWCNGGMHVRTRTRSNDRDERFYACTSHYNRGPSICQNMVQAPMEDVDNEVIKSIRYTLRPAVVEAVIAGVREAMEPERRTSQRDALAAKLAEADRQVNNLADAITHGGNIPVLVVRLQEAERTRQALATELDGLAGDVIPRLDWPALERQTRALLADWRGVLGRNLTDARGALTAMLQSPIRFTPILEESQRGYRFRGDVSIGEILAGSVLVTNHGVPGQN
jgi:site-specific DNA recombinase